MGKPVKKVYLVISFDKEAGVLNDVSVYLKKEEALDEIEEVSAELINGTDVLEEQEDGTKRCVRTYNDSWECELYEREVL